ncbi:MAG: class I SAM-dependent methyltransferase [Chloroflexota bacterium]
MSLKPHSAEWYERLSTLQSGYYYPWKSRLPALNGEDVFLAMLRDLLTPEKDVLEVGCGHGEVALQFAASCRTLLAYDRAAAYIRLAQTAAEAQNVKNVTFVCADSKITANGQVRIPAEDHSFDVIYSRRGPLHWIDDARRVARPGAILFQLNPWPLPPPIWNQELPKPFQLMELDTPMEQIVRQQLAQNQLPMQQCWTFQLQEMFSTPEDFYTFIAWGHDPAEVPSLAEIAPALERIFQAHAVPEGLEVPFGRFLWQSIIR